MAKKAEKIEIEAKGKAKRVDDIKTAFEKDFGKGSLMGPRDKVDYHEVISTGSIGLNRALGVGGLPKGRIVEVFGPESSGKTTLCLQVIAEAHAADKECYCAFVDVEHAIDTGYAKALGVDLDRLRISQPNYGEQALEIADRLILSGEFAVVVIDSVAALVPKAELDAVMGGAPMASQARLMSQALRKMTPGVSKTKTLCIFINQLREKIGVMFGNPEVTTGGNALKFYASVRLDIRRKATEKEAIRGEGEVRIGNPVTVKVIKNKVAPPFTRAEFDVLYGEGIDRWGELLDIAVEDGIITKSGTFFNYGDTKLGQGRANASQLLKDNDGLFNEIKKKVLSKVVIEAVKEYEEPDILDIQEKEYQVIDGGLTMIDGGEEQLKLNGNDNI